jgi:hypothetical protein
MKTLRMPTWILLAAGVLPGPLQTAAAQAIYKCPIAGGVEYTDRPCPGDRGQLIHQPDDSETIDHLIASGQFDAAKRYADAHHVEALYKLRLDAYRQHMEQIGRQQAADALAEQNAQAKAEREANRQAVADEQARQARLEAQNELLREQNAQYQQQLNQPAVNYVPYYGGVREMPRRRDRDREHDHDHDRNHDGDKDKASAPKQPVFHPCTPIAGGTVKCS